MGEIVKHENGRAAALAVPIRGIEDLLHIGGVLAASGFFKDTRGEAQAVAKILAGMELGISPVASLRSVYIVEGQIALAYPLIASLIKSSRKYNYKVLEKSAKACIIEFYENGELAGTESITWQQVEARGLHKSRGGSVKDVWAKFPENMLFARCLSNGAKAYAPEVFNGSVYTPDELGAEVDGTTGAMVQIEVAELPGVAQELAACEEEGCGNLIRDFTNEQGKTMLASKIIEGTQQKYGKALCWDCAQKAKAAYLAESERIEAAIKESFPVIHEATPAPESTPNPEPVPAKGSKAAALATAKSRYATALECSVELGIEPATEFDTSWTIGSVIAATDGLVQAITDAIYAAGLESGDIPTEDLPYERDSLADYMRFARENELVEYIKTEQVKFDDEDADYEEELLTEVIV